MSNTPTSSAQVAEGMNLKAERAAPCPFCGGSASPQRYGNSNGGASYAVWCNSCHISTAWMHGDDGECRAIEAWNRRTAAPVEEGVALPPLPPIDEHWMTNDHTYTAEQVRQAQREAIAPYAERIRQLECELADWKKSNQLLAASRDRWKDTSGAAS